MSYLVAISIASSLIKYNGALKTLLNRTCTERAESSDRSVIVVASLTLAGLYYIVADVSNSKHWPHRRRVLPARVTDEITAGRDLVPTT